MEFFKITNKYINTYTPMTRLALITAGCFLYGLITTNISSPNGDGTAFWVSNVAAPYIVIPALAGAWFRRGLLAVLAGSMAGAAMIAGFYNILAVSSVTNSQLGLAESVPRIEAISMAYGNWLRNFVLGDPGGLPWLSIGIIVGGITGYLGYILLRSGIGYSRVLIASPFTIEPIFYIFHFNALFGGPAYSLSVRNITIWGIEFMLGLSIMICLIVRTKGLYLESR